MSVWLPSPTVVLSQLTVYGAALAVATIAPSTRKSTRVIEAPPMAAALAVSLTVRFTVAPGDVMVMVGAGHVPP